MRLVFLFIYPVYQLIAACTAFFLLLKTRHRNHRRGIPDFKDRIKIWFHAASVGEVRLAATLKDYYDFSGCLITTMTETGLKTAQELFPKSRIMLVPYDTAGYMRRLLSHIKPQRLVIFETELWPSMIIESKRAGIPLYLFHGRISDRSIQRYVLLRPFISVLLKCFDGVFARCAEDAGRLAMLGAHVVNVPSLKIPVPVKQDNTLSWLIRTGRKLLVAGSLHPEEMSRVLQGFDPDKYCMIIAPRHLERIGEFEDIISQSGFSCSRLSDKKNADIIIADAMGLLMQLYKAADAAFVGGSLCPVGGHNMMEPAVYGIPVLFGPYTQNFKFQSHYLVQHGIGFQTENIWETLAKPLDEIRIKEAQKKINHLCGQDSSFYARILHTPPRRRRYCAFRMSALGDCMLLAPVLKELLNHADVQVITKPQFAWIFKQYGLQTLECATYTDVFKTVFSHQFDAFLDFHANGRSYFASLFFPAVQRYKKRGILRRAACFPFLRRFIKNDFSVYESCINLCRNICPDFSDPVLQSGISEKYAVICPGASSLEKAAPEHVFEYAAKFFHENGYRIILCGSESEAAVCEKIALHSGVMTENLAGKTSLEEMYHIIEKCSVFVGNDSGPMHIAEVFDKPLLAFFGPTAQCLGFYPVNKRAIIAEKPVSCRPCSIHGNVPCKKKQKLCMQYSDTELRSLFNRLIEMVNT